MRLVARTNEPLGVSDISRRLSIVKSTTLGILKALEEEGFLLQDRLTKKYVPGNILFEFSKSVLRSMELPFVAKPFLDRLAEHVDETVILVAREHENTYRVLEVSEPKKELRVTVPVGTRFPLYAGALMKIFFSQMTNEDILRLVGENPPPKYTELSVTGVDDLLGQVEQTRERGYASDLEEYRKGVRGLSVLVFRGARACGAISIFGLASSMEDERLPDMVSHMKDTARLISRKLTLMAEGPGSSDGPVDPPGGGLSEAT